MGAAERTVRSSVTAGESGAPSQSNLARCFARSEEHTSEFQSRLHLVCRLLLEKKKKKNLYLRSTYCLVLRSTKISGLLCAHQRFRSLSSCHISMMSLIIPSVRALSCISTSFS